MVSGHCGYAGPVHFPIKPWFLTSSHFKWHVQERNAATWKYNALPAHNGSKNYKTSTTVQCSKSIMKWKDSKLLFNICLVLVIC